MQEEVEEQGSVSPPQSMWWYSAHRTPTAAGSAVNPQPSAASTPRTWMPCTEQSKAAEGQGKAVNSSERQ